jgi:hypothetical protein
MLPKIIFTHYLITASLVFSLVGIGYSEVFRGPIPGQPPLPPLQVRPRILPPVTESKPALIDLNRLQKQYQELRTQRDRMEKEIEISVTRIRELKTELKKADNPVSKFFYRRQLETQFESFRDKVDQLGLVESRLSTIIRELGKRIAFEPGIGPLNPIPHPGHFPERPLHPIPPPPPMVAPEWEPEPLSFPPNFDQWEPTEKEPYIQEQIRRISEEKKQLDLALQQHQKDLLKLKKMLEEIKPPQPKPGSR